jgi:hypothetical protein
MTDQLATIRDYSDLVAALRARANALDVSRGTIDEVAGLPSGYAGKLLALVPSKTLGRVSLGPVLGALGVMLVLVEDAAALDRVRDRLVKRRWQRTGGGATHWRQEQVRTRALVLLREWAVAGGKQRFAGMTPEQIREHQSRAGKASARKRRERAIQAQGLTTAAMPQPSMRPPPDRNTAPSAG